MLRAFSDSLVLNSHFPVQDWIALVCANRRRRFSGDKILRILPTAISVPALDPKDMPGRDRRYPADLCMSENPPPRTREFL